MVNFNRFCAMAIGACLYYSIGGITLAADDPILPPPPQVTATKNEAETVGDQTSASDAETNSKQSDWKWEIVSAQGQPVARHEAALAAHNNRIYLLGGRRINPVSVYDPQTNAWTDRSKTPLELHHFQAVTWGEAIYLMGAMTGPYPNEKPVEKIVVYYPREDRFDFVHSIPESRRRGGAGAVVYNDKIYLVGGITNGHIGGTVAWFDQYDPATGIWTPLPDAPHARDHVSVTVAEGKLIFAGGRKTNRNQNGPFSGTVAETDIYDFDAGKWLSAQKNSDIPTLRAGAMAFSWGNLAIIGGGESTAQKSAHQEVEAFDVTAYTWKPWPSLNHGRHGTNFAILNNHVYTASGCLNRGGKPETTIMERLSLPRP